MNQSEDEREDPGFEPVSLPLDGTLDLHTFHPRDVGDVVADYLEACRAEGVLQVRIVHGKGVGNLRRTVHAVLERTPGVVGFRLAGIDGGSWGATLVDLDPLPDAPEQKKP